MFLSRTYWQTGLLLALGLMLLILVSSIGGAPNSSLRFICLFNGIATGLLLLNGGRFWPFLLPALLLVPMWLGQSAPVIVGNATISLLTIMLATRLLRGLAERNRLRLAEALQLLLLGGLVVSLPSAGLKLSMSAAHPAGGMQALFTLWTAEVIGFLVAIPLLLALREGLGNLWRQRPLELCLAAVCASAGASFLYGVDAASAGGWQFLFFPLIIWVALRLGLGGVALTILILALALGKILSNVPNEMVLSAQLLLLNLIATGLLLASSTEEEDSAMREIAAERHNLDAILNTLPMLVYLENRNGDFVYANRAFATLTGLPAADLAGFPVAPQRDKIGLPRIPSGMGQEGVECTIQVNGRAHTLICHQVPLLDAKGKLHGDCFMATDISERLASEEQLRLAAQVLENASEGIVMTDARGAIIAVNPAFTRITGYTPDEAVNKVCHTFRLIEQGTPMGREINAKLQAEGCWQGELPGHRKNGEDYPAWGSLSQVRDVDGRVTHHVAVFSDFTSRKEAEDRLQFLAQRDPLTRLHNRNALQDKLTTALEVATACNTRVALFFIDLDRFKTINDSLGHSIGDELLQVVALRLRFCLKDRDFIARFGGDEFTVLLEDAPSDDDLSTIAARIVSEIARPCIVHGQDMFVTCSLGVSRFPGDARDADTLMRTADMAMYRAKDQGKNTFMFHADDMSVQVTERNLLEGRLRAALARNQFTLYYQPQYELAGEEFYGAEALIRWHHPELGMVPPASFIPLAEESGLIEAIGSWVIREACRQMRAWIDAGVDPRQVAVNLSPRQFRRGLLVDTIQGALDDAGLAPERLTVEITESIIMQNPDEAREILKELREMGVRVAIDDFGSGYSSLSYLKVFPLDTLKIDRSFITPLPEDSNSAAIVEAIVVMARKLGLSVVAEGVETTAQASFLRNIGCDTAQGYLYSRPLPSEMVPAALNVRDFPSEV